MKDWIAEEGSPLPLGATWIENANAWNFALYSKYATSVTLLFYTDSDFVNPVATYQLSYLQNKSGRIWHCRIAQGDVRGARYYAYSVDGPKGGIAYEWHAFDPEKIILDPYAKSVYFPPEFSRSAALGPGSNAGKAPLSVLVAGPSSSGEKGDRRRRLHQSDTIIYELHVRGFTRNPNSKVSDEKRGTFAGVIEKIPYLKELGITAIEIMPIFQFDPQEGNYWGYMPLCFFAPHHGYGSDPDACGQHEEFRAMVKALHAANIEVILDVVYNHTAEGDQLGPVYSYKGIDNSTYYVMTDNSENPYADFSGTGNTLNCVNRHVRIMIVDSLRYWSHQMHVDGFRFDLASVFSRNGDGSLNLDEPPIFGDILSDNDLWGIRLIAEPWDAGGAYQLGRSFPSASWFQWNGQFRDDIRRFVRGDPGLVGTLMQRLYGSDDLFPDDVAYAFHPYQSVNYINSHDGFTLYDLVSYNDKHNRANGNNNTDGTNDNFSWNCGWEGDQDVPEKVIDLRKRQTKNFCCLLFLANGTPMFRAGDEFLQTQGGNNNAYNQDNETSWLDWSRLDAHRDIFRFFCQMIRFRKNHPSLCRSRFWREDVRWFGVNADVDMNQESRQLAVYLCGESSGDNDLYFMINAADKDVTFAIQIGSTDEWFLTFNTALPSPDDFCEPIKEPIDSLTIMVRSRSIVGFVRDQNKHSH